MFDIYVAKGCRTLPQMSDLIDAHPELAKQELHTRMLSKSPGFLELNLPLEVAKKLTWRLKYEEARALCTIIPIRYRENEPIFNTETAYPIAERMLKELQQKEYPELHFSQVVHAPGHSTIMYITFFSSAKEWQDEGLIPGAVSASVDRLDGHLWTHAEIIELSADIQ